MKGFVAQFMFALFLAVSACAQPENLHPTAAENYKVYDAILADMFAGGKVTFDNQANVKQLVIRDHTLTDYAWDVKHENWDRVKQHLPALTDEVIQNYEKTLKSSVKLSRSFSLPLKYVLISQKQFESIFDKPANANQTAENWSKFYDRFPESGGYISLSNVGFNGARNQALVYFVHWCHQLCGTGHYLLLNLQDGEWRVYQKGEMWIS